MALTNKQAVVSAFAFEVPDNLVEKVMLDRSVTEGDNYDSTLQEDVDLCIADVCLSLVNLASESEGGLSIVFDNKKLMNLRTQLLRKWDASDEDGGVSGINSVKPW